MRLTAREPLVLGCLLAIWSCGNGGGASDSDGAAGSDGTGGDPGAGGSGIGGDLGLGGAGLGGSGVGGTPGLGGSGIGGDPGSGGTGIGGDPGFGGSGIGGDPGSGGNPATGGTGIGESTCVPGVDTGDACDPAVDTEDCERSDRTCVCGADSSWTCTPIGQGTGGQGTGGQGTGGQGTGGEGTGGEGTGGEGTGGEGTGGSTACGAPGPQGERYPFPQNVDYPYGVQSSAISNEHVRDWYDSWRNQFLQECNGNLRPGVDPLTNSLVEAQGFAMIAAAYMGDKDAVDRLHQFYLSKTSSSSCGLQGWKVDCNGVIDQGAATDGDIDVASGLIVAHWQWPNDGYDDLARDVISNLSRVIADCGGISALYPGCGGGSPWGGCNETDISYYSPGFFRYFAQISGNSAWDQLADDTHVIRDAAAHPSTGLVPDWQSVSGTPGAGSRKGYFSFDAIRAPFKSGLDYIWHGNAAAGAWCERLSTWAHGQGVGSIVDEYNLDGSRVGSNHNMAVVGSMAVCAMANSQDVADAFVEETGRLSSGYWYSKYLGNLYLLAVTGNMWNIDLVPDCG
jgi:endo-1,4-beta-D-glucanase Y